MAAADDLRRASGHDARRGHGHAAAVGYARRRGDGPAPPNRRRPMIRALAVLTLTLAVLAPAAFGQDALQDELAPDPGMDAPTCGSFVTLDSLAQIQMLSHHPAARRRDRPERRERGAAMGGGGDPRLRRPSRPAAGRCGAGGAGRMSEARPVPAEAPPARRRRGPAPPALHPGLALGQRAHLLRHADERADDLQRPSAALLGRSTAPTTTRPGCEIGVEDGRGYLRVGDASFDTTGVLGTRTVDGRRRTAPSRAGRRSRRATTWRCRGAGT